MVSFQANENLRSSSWIAPYSNLSTVTLNLLVLLINEYFQRKSVSIVFAVEFDPALGVLGCALNCTKYDGLFVRNVAPRNLREGVSTNKVRDYFGYYFTMIICQCWFELITWFVMTSYWSYHRMKYQQGWSWPMSLSIVSRIRRVYYVSSCIYQF